MSSGSDQRIRHVAIVLQSLDSATSRGLLSQLPPAQSKLVRQAMVNLGSITPQERASAFQSMQGLLGNVPSLNGPHPKQSATNANPSPAVQLLALQSSSNTDQIEFSPAATQQTDQTSWQTQPVQTLPPRPDIRWQRLPPDALAEILQRERPIVIATVLNQVSVEHATAIVLALPIPVASATLAALPHLHLTDTAILQDIQQELERKIGQYQGQFQIPSQASPEGISRLQAIVASMPVAQQEIWTNAISQSNPVLATKLGWHPLARPALAAAPNPPSINSASDRTSYKQSPNPTRPEHKDFFDESMILPFTSPSDHSSRISKESLKQQVAPKFNETVQHSTTSANGMEDLLQLTDREFVAVLHACQPQIVLLALSGASKKMVARVERLLPAKDIQRLRKRLNSQGQINLREVDAAQARIVETAAKMRAAGQLGAMANVSSTTAA